MPGRLQLRQFITQPLLTVITALRIPTVLPGAGVPNSWYSDVYPNPPITTNTSSVTLIVNIRDCNKNYAPVSDKLNITLSSGDPNIQINGNNLPYSITTQNGGRGQFLASVLKLQAQLH
jgi:hypothetical protein